MKIGSVDVHANRENAREGGSGTLVAFDLGVAAFGLLVVYLALQFGMSSTEKIETFLYVIFFAGLGCLLVTLGISCLLTSWGRAGRDGVMDRKHLEKRETAEAGIPGSPVARKSRIGSCMVCRDDLHVGDKIAACPHCSRIAHRGDLLEWVHIKGSCPVCGRHLDEDQVQVLNRE